MDLNHELSQRFSSGKMPEIVAYIGNDQTRFDELMAAMLGDDEQVSKYAAWVFSHCVTKHPQLLHPHLNSLILKLQQPNIHDAIVRSTVKALAETDLPEDVQGHALNHCFDLLLNPKTAVAIQVHAMQSIFNISKNEPDLLRELSEVIEERMPHGTAGFKSRGRRILKDIGKALA